MSAPRVRKGRSIDDLRDPEKRVDQGADAADADPVGAQVVKIGPIGGPIKVGVVKVRFGVLRVVVVHGGLRSQGVR
jgi:hypothetical protein